MDKTKVESSAESAEFSRIGGHGGGQKTDSDLEGSAGATGRGSAGATGASKSSMLENSPRDRDDRLLHDNNIDSPPPPDLQLPPAAHRIPKDEDDEPVFPSPSTVEEHVDWIDKRSELQLVALTVSDVYGEKFSCFDKNAVIVRVVRAEKAAGDGGGPGRGVMEEMEGDVVGGDKLFEGQHTAPPGTGGTGREGNRIDSRRRGARRRRDDSRRGRRRRDSRDDSRRRRRRRDSRDDSRRGRRRRDNRDDSRRRGHRREHRWGDDWGGAAASSAARPPMPKEPERRHDLLPKEPTPRHDVLLKEPAPRHDPPQPKVARARPRFPSPPLQEPALAEENDTKIRAPRETARSFVQFFSWNECSADNVELFPGGTHADLLEEKERRELKHELFKEAIRDADGILLQEVGKDTLAFMVTAAEQATIIAACKVFKYGDYKEGQLSIFKDTLTVILKC